MSPRSRQVTLQEINSSWPSRTISGSDLVQDSREVTPGSIFVAIGSSGASGHQFAQAAIEAGASYVLVEHSFFHEVAQLDSEKIIGVEGLSEHLGTLASTFWDNPSSQLTIVGVTGTNGKTSVVQLIAQSWSQLEIKVATIGTLGAGIFGEPLNYTGLTTPSVCQVHKLLAQFLSAGATHVAMELSSHALAQNRVDGVKFSAVGFTNISRDHLDFHGTMEKYAQAKESIFSLPDSPTIIVNIDDEFGETWAKSYEHSHDIITVSSHSIEADIYASEIVLGAQGFECQLTHSGISEHVSVELLGRFNVDNVLIVCGVLASQKHKLPTIAKVISQLHPVFGRMNRIKPYSSSPLVVVDYAHTAQALELALTALKPYNFSRVVTVFGCTGDRDTGKRPDMARIAELHSDVVIVTDDDVHWEDGDEILRDIRSGFQHPENIVELRDREQALRYAIATATESDVVFIAGKGHEEYLLIKDQKVPFSDTDVSTKLLELKQAGML